MVDLIRRKLLKTGAAAAVLATTPAAIAQQSGNEDSGRFYERGMFASVTKKQARASRCCSSRAEG